MRWAACFLFLGSVFTYVFFSPGAIAGMGYTGEDMRATDELLSLAGDWAAGRQSHSSIDWPRNGIVPLLFDAPFIALGRAHAQKDLWEDRYLALGPVLATALLLTVLFLWLEKLTANPVWSFSLTMIAGFATMIWPYAYIGLETKQSLALLIAGYSTFCSQPIHHSLRTAIFIVSCAAAVSVKSTGLFLFPAVAWLAYEYFVRGRLSPRIAARLVGALALIGAVFLLNSYTRSLFWAKIGGTSGFLDQWMVRDVSSFFDNLISFFGSANKGLFVYAPVTLLGLLAIPLLPRAERGLKWFTLLTLGGLAGGFSLLTDWSDETWGPRYLHSAIAPLVLCLGLSPLRFRMRTTAALAGLAAAGFCVAFLGAFFTYGSLQGAATLADQDTIEAYQGDVVWNHIRFNARLLGIWMKNRNTATSEPSMWVPAHHWFYAVPAGAPPWKPVDLGPFAHPQSISMREWTLPQGMPHSAPWYFCILCLPCGVALLVYGFLRTARKGGKVDAGPIVY
jgi:hypothetical protein